MATCSQGLPHRSQAVRKKGVLQVSQWERKPFDGDKYFPQGQSYSQEWAKGCFCLPKGRTQWQSMFFLAAPRSLLLIPKHSLGFPEAYTLTSAQTLFYFVFIFIYLFIFLSGFVSMFLYPKCFNRQIGENKKAKIKAIKADASNYGQSTYIHSCSSLHTLYNENDWIWLIQNTSSRQLLQ